MTSKSVARIQETGTAAPDRPRKVPSSPQGVEPGSEIPARASEPGSVAPANLDPGGFGRADPQAQIYARRASFTQVSFRVIVRLITNPGPLPPAPDDADSSSRQKYPNRSNWK